MNKKYVLLALALYGLFVFLVINFYKGSPSSMTWEDREEFNRQYIAKLVPGQHTLEQILTDLGTPDSTEAIRKNNNYYQVTFYRTQHVKSDGITTQEECSYLLFVNDILTGSGLGIGYPDNWQVIDNHTKN
ncbi:DUF3192 domain-containing protein [Thalassomonas actiniarum]|uniref:DUF3192 domain-containing protein n=1 Tax=Thalassomonas actiniarum TaxID=485447 RepID=A0AAE9YP78_9GAMM|nr:DUF3192 domain-containing protein [Thalassomonas actiniarum]WDD97709.1 DUF3192 domain-containing protein [Thalassomonas actiniarum]